MQIDIIVHGVFTPQRMHQKPSDAKDLCPPHRAIVKEFDNAFECEKVLRNERDLKEVQFPSKFKNVGTNSNTSNIKKNNLVRWRTKCNTYFNHRPTHSFKVLNKDKKNLKEYVKS